MPTSAKVIADSICNGHRLTTMELTHPLIVHAEFMTHCAFARNASSSRAIPFSVMVKSVETDPYIPRTFGTNQKGMQPAKPLTGWKLERARLLHLKGLDLMVEIAQEMAAVNCKECKGSGKDHNGIYCFECHGTGEGLNVHKQIANRYLHTWGRITCAVTGTWDAWSNYFALRCSSMAQEAIMDQADMAQFRYFISRPKELKPGEWHLPYISDEDYKEIVAHFKDGLALPEISSGRVARVSYLTQDGKRDFNKDIELHDRLQADRPIHASPFEHVCMAMGDNERYGKYTGWKAYRHMIPGEYITDFVPNHPKLINIAGEWMCIQCLNLGLNSCPDCKE